MHALCTSGAVKTQVFFCFFCFLFVCVCVCGSVVVVVVVVFMHHMQIFIHSFIGFRKLTVN